MVKQELANALAGGLVPVRRRRLVVHATGWLAATWLGLVVWMVTTGGPRPGLLEQLSTPRFAIEIVLGGIAATMALLVGLLLSIPGRLERPRAALLGFTALALWVGLLAFGLLSPALEVSMVGKRDHCYLETGLLALVPLGVGLFLAARFAPLVRTTVGWWLGVAAAAVPALLMQLFCMYEPWHGLTHHLLPIAAVAALGALAGRAFLPRY